MTEQARSQDSEVTIPTQRDDEERFEYHGTVCYQRKCPDCKGGLLLNPARWCGHCGGSGFLVRWVRE